MPNSRTNNGSGVEFKQSPLAPVLRGEGLGVRGESGVRGVFFSLSTKLAKKTSAALRDSVPSLLITNGTGEESDKNALLPLWRRYSWPSCHSNESANGTKS